MGDEKQIRKILDRIPDDFISEPARNFAMAMLNESNKLLRDLENG